MRNHGSQGQWHSRMDYEWMALDVYAYLVASGITAEKSVSLVGHSMGGKTAITLACLFPRLVNKLASLDAPPVDRNPFDHLNQSSRDLIDSACSLGDLTPLGRKGAADYVKQKISDPQLQQAMLLNLNEQGGWRVNLEAIRDNQNAIYGFKKVGQFDGPTLMLNGAQSF